MDNAGTTRICVEALGVVIPLDVSGPDLTAAVSDAWRDCRSWQMPDAAGLSVGIAGFPGQRDVEGADAAEVMHNLSSAVTQRAISARIGDLVMLHAAALADPSTGATAVLVAASGTGKTTASRALGTRYAYLSDETAGITVDGEVVPYRKPLSIIERGTLKTQRAASSLGLNVTSRRYHLGTVLVLDRRPDLASDPAITPLDTIDAIAALAPQASYLPSMAKPLHRLADMLHRVGGAHRVTYRESASLEPLLQRLLRSDAL